MAERFGDFELLSLLSADAALESFLAQPTSGGPQVVLRRMRPSLAQQPGSRDSFLSDAQAAMRLQHTGAARVVAVGEVGHQPYLAQERIEGDSLESIILRARSLPEWPLPLPRALALFLPAVEGLAAAHAQTPALVHREVSPRNVFISPQGRAVMTGFGLARSRRSAGLGISDAFLSPEQMTGRPLDAASDVFTAALVLFELVCGRLPATGTVGEIAARIGALELDGAEAVHAAAAPLAGVLKKALARHGERYATAGELLAALGALGLAPESPEAVAQWVKSLPDQPAAPTVPAGKPVPVETASGRLVAISPETKPAAAPGPRRLTRKTVYLGLAMVGALVAVANGLMFGSVAPVPLDAADHPVPENFKTELLSVPSGASVRVNDKRAGKTPLQLDSKRDQIYTVRFDNEENTVEVVVQNARTIEVDMVSGELVRDDRYVPSPHRASKKEKKKKGAAATETDEAAGEETQPAPTFVAAAPARFTLERAHQVRVDEVPQLALVAGQLQQTTVGYRAQGAKRNPGSPSYQTQGLKPRDQIRAMTGDTTYQPPDTEPHLSMVLSRLSSGLKLTAVNPGPVSVPAVPSWAFALAERTNGVSDFSPSFLFANQRSYATSSLVVIVEGDNRFNVEGLAGSPWRLTLRPREKTTASQVVLKVHRAVPGNPAQLDGAALETNTAVLEADGSYLLTGAQSLWLAVPTVSSIVAGTIDVAVEHHKSNE